MALYKFCVVVIIIIIIIIVIIIIVNSLTIGTLTNYLSK